MTFSVLSNDAMEISIDLAVVIMQFLKSCMVNSYSSLISFAFLFCVDY